MKTLRFFLVGILTVNFLASCSSDNEEPSTNELKEVNLSRTEVALSNQQTPFGFDVFGKIINYNGDDSNKFYSPLCLSMGLSMVANGAEGDAKAQILSAFNIENANLEELNRVNKVLLESFPKLDHTTALSLANSAWIDNTFPVKNTFTALLRDNYDAQCKNVNLMDEKSIDLINSWCKKQTKGMIPEIIKEIPETARMYLLSALYFEGKWEKAFDKNRTQNKLFFNVDGTTTSVPMMQKLIGQAEIHRTQCFDIMEQKFGNGAYIFQMFRPRDGYKLAEAIKDFNFNEIENSQEIICDVNFGLPKFSITYDTKDVLMPILYELGIKNIFSNSNELRGISDEEIYVSLIRQVSTITIDEKKAESSSINEIEISVTSPGDPSSAPQIVNYTLDHPFMFAIYEQSTKTFLFMGAINKL